MTTAEMRAFLVEHVAGFDPATSDLAVVDAYASYTNAAAAREPLTLDEVKLNLRVNTTSEDKLITDLIIDAREFVERETGLVLTPRTVTETARELGRWIDLASWPITAVLAIRISVAGVMTTLPPGLLLFSIARRPVRLLPASPGWGIPGGLCGAPGLPVQIDVEAGYATPADVPRNVTRAMHLLIAFWYTNRMAGEVGGRATAIEIPFGVAQLLQPLKVMRI